jgi:hypothetical protein
MLKSHPVGWFNTHSRGGFSATPQKHGATVQFKIALYIGCIQFSHDVLNRFHSDTVCLFMQIRHDNADSSVVKMLKPL